MEIKRKSVAFNVNDPDQAEMLEHASKRENFSSYIKRLIQRDMDGIRAVSNVAFYEEPHNDGVDSGLMEGLL